MAKRWFYKEEVFFTTEEKRLSDENQDRIVELLGKNVAVGVVGGFYEEGFPVYFISAFALNNIGMTYEQFMEKTGGSFLQAVYEPDRNVFTKVFLLGEEENREYRIINGKGEPVWVREIRMESVASDGRRIWISAVRLIDEERRDIQLSNEAFRMLRDTYFRISEVNLNKNTIVDLKFVESEALEVERLNGDFRMTIASCAQNHVEEKDRVSFLNVMSAENLKRVFMEDASSIHFSYLRLVEGEWKWVRTDLVPVENFSEENARLMWYVKNITEEKARETEMTDQMLRKNAELFQAKKELEEANAKIRESNEKLRRALSVEEQYRQAIVSEAVFVFNVNVTKNLIEEEFYEIVGGEMEPVLSRMGMQAPCNADDFFLRWGKERIFPEDREVYVQTINTRHLLEAYERGENELIMEVETSGADEQPVVLRHTILLTKDGISGDILALNTAKDITDIRKKDRETKKALLDAYEAADRASCAKTDFLSKMSHDIRTPMNAIIGMTAIAGTKLHDPDGMEECLAKVSTASQHLLSLINEVLDMSRIESGAMTLDEEEFNLLNIIDNMVNMLSAAARDKRQKIVFRAHGVQNTNVRGDAKRLQQIFANVISNSIKYTEEGGKISIEITEKASQQEHVGCYEFVFKDNGIGMSKKFLQHIYDPFERADDVRTSKIQGTGLGMTISRNIIQMGGDIQIESELGIGTTVTITVPLKYQVPGVVNREDLAGRTVLVVDDSPFAGETTNVLLSNLGMRGEWVQSGEEALDYMKEKRRKVEDVFAILLDVNMPGMNGMETAKAIRRQEGVEIPIIFVSAHEWVDIEVEARLAGVNAFIRKPFDKTRLLTAFRNFIPREVVKPAEGEVTLEQIGEADYSDKRILVVEDNDLNREIAMEILSMTGAMIETAENGKEAVDMVLASEEGYYDLILMDLQMPVMNGYEATTTIRAMEREDAGKVPIVAMTANAFLEDIQQSKACGMNEHMSKPLDVDQLQRMLARWLLKKSGN
jgi:signal transduction histidine kinase/CheY-like chemotaxis protein